jgi:hypothetical protein
MDLAVTSADELAVDINASKESAATFIMAAQKLAAKDTDLVFAVYQDKNMPNPDLLYG